MCLCVPYLLLNPTPGLSLISKVGYKYSDSSKNLSILFMYNERYVRCLLFRRIFLIEKLMLQFIRNKHQILSKKTFSFPLPFLIPAMYIYTDIFQNNNCERFSQWLRYCWFFPLHVYIYAKLFILQGSEIRVPQISLNKELVVPLKKLLMKIFNFLYPFIFH